MEQFGEVSTGPRARLTGGVYLVYFVTAIVGAVLVSRGLGVAGKFVEVVSTVCYLVVTLLFYGLFKPVSGGLSMLAAVFSLGGCVFMFLGVFHLERRANPLMFFGPFCLVIGYLIWRSGFLPRVLGVAMVIAGVGWLVFLIPGLPVHLSMGIKAVGFLAELSLCLWLLVRGVNVQQWRELRQGL